MGLFDRLETYASHIAVIDEQSRPYSYDELLSDADALGRNIKRRRLTLFITSNSYASIAGYVGLLRAGSVPLMVNSTINADDLIDTLERFRPHLIYAPKALAQTFGFAAARHELGDYGLYETGQKIDYRLHGKLALLLTTSGSTGSHSLVRLSRRNLASNTAAIMTYLGINSFERAITTMPMSYSYGLSIINTHLAAGASIVATEASLVSPTFWTLLKDHKVTNFGGVPFIYDMLKKLRFANMDLPYLRYITQAGGKLSDPMIADFAAVCRSKDIDFFVMYGQTEATARMTYVPPWHLRHKLGSVGLPVPGGKISLEDEGSREINTAYVTGELVYRGHNVSMGYAETRKDLSRGNTNRGVLRTGDLAEFDEDGYVYIVGRKKRFLKLYGHRVNLEEVEQTLKKAGIEAACAGLDDAMRVYVEGGGEPKAVRQHLLDHTTIPRKGFKVIPIKAIPRNDAGKIRYHLLGSEFGATQSDA